MTNLQNDQFLDLNWLHSTGEKFDTNLIFILAQKLISSSTKDIYELTIRHSKSGKLISEKVNAKWNKRCVNVSSIVTRVKIGKLMHSKEEQEIIDREMAFHLGFPKRRLGSGYFIQDYVYDVDTNHFTVDVNGGRTIAIKGIAIMVMSGGRSNAHLQVPIKIF